MPLRCLSSVTGCFGKFVGRDFWLSESNPWHRPQAASEDSGVLLHCSLLAVVLLHCWLLAVVLLHCSRSVLLYHLLSVFKQSMPRIRREMNVERGRERNTDSKEGLRNVVCRFRLLGGCWKRSQYCKIWYVLWWALTKICSICCVLWETILKIPIRKSKSRITNPMIHFVSQH